jgi:hypothetical protein
VGLGVAGLRRAVAAGITAAVEVLLEGAIVLSDQILDRGLLGGAPAPQRRPRSRI